MKKPKIPLKKARNITTGMVVVALLLFGVGWYLDCLDMEQDLTMLFIVLAIVMVVLLIAEVVFMHLFLRCPHCGRPVSGKVGYKDHQYCPACGKKLEL